MANDLSLTPASRFSTTGGEAASEVVAFDSFRYFVTNSASERVDVFRADVGLVGTLDVGTLPGFAGVTSVAAKNGLVAVAIDGGEIAGVPQRGHVALFDADSLSLINYVTVGFLPDSVIFSGDGSEIYVANEGEPTAGGDAPGSVSIVTFPEGFDRLADVTDVDFSSFDGQEDVLRAQGVRIFPGVAASRDLEPEYIAVDPTDGSILVTLQEANTVARIDRADLSVELLPQGAVNHAELGNGIDGSDRDGAIRIANWPVQGLRMADALAAFEIDGQTYYATANEGDSRDFDEARVKDLALDPSAFPLADALQEDANLGRLQVSNIDGDVDGDGDYDQLFSYGSRSFTIYDAAGNVVFDSGDDFEQIIATLAPERFNTDEPGDADEVENRSDAKGPEPEAIAVGEVDGRMIAVIGLERDGGLMLYDVTDPANAAFLTYVDSRAAGDVAPEVIAFIPGAISPTGFAQIAVAYEDSGSTAVYDLTFTGAPVGAGDPGAGEAPAYDLQITELWPGNEPGENLTSDWIEITNFGTDPWVQGLDPILYYDDDSADPSAADPINGISEIAPGESVIVVIDDESAVAEFIDAWSSTVEVGDVQVGWSDGSGLGQGGDGAALFVGGPSDQTLADFEAFPDAQANGGQSWNVQAGAFSAADDGFGSVATSEVNDENQPAVGSPGVVQTIFTLELLHIADQEASSEAVFDAPRLSAVMAALEAQDLGGDGLPDNTLRLSSGDAILPGLFFQASEAVFGAAGIADIQIQNELGLQAIAFGNHEFDFGSPFIASLIDGSAGEDAAEGPAGDFSALVGSTLEGLDFTGADFPYLSANLDYSTEATLAPLEVAGGQAPAPNSVASSIVLEEGGELIGVVGATTPTIDFISSPGDLTVLPEAFDGDPTAEQLDALAALIQAEVDALLADNPGMNKVILLSHMQQIALEQELATRLTGVDIIVGGGSNTRLLDENDRLRDGDTKQGDYPIFVENAGGATTAIVNTDGSYKYVGRLVIDFDAEGDIIAGSYDPEISGAYATDAQGVADLDAESLIDPEIQAIADAIGDRIAETEGNVFGVSDVFLEGRRSEVRTQETNLGNLTADANLAAAKAADPTVVVSIKNGGGIREEIGQVIVPPGGTEPELTPNEEIRDGDGNVIKPEGGISENDIAGALRFNNGLSLLTVTAQELVDILEHGIAASSLDDSNTQGRFPQVSGVEFSFDLTAPAGDRIQSMAIVDENGAPTQIVVENGDLAIAADATFRIVTLNFLAGGGDGYPFPQGPEADRVDLYDLDGDAVDDDAFTGLATFAPDGTEQDALAEYLVANFSAETPFADPDTPRELDERLQNLAFREDAVLGDLVETDPELLLSELVVTPTGGEFIEIHNAGDATVDLSDVYLTDATFAPGGQFYYNLVTGADFGGGGFGDFFARFPDAARIDPGEYLTVAIAGSGAFLAEYGFAPDFELFDDGSDDGEAVMREAAPGSINGQGGLTNGGEFVSLFEWDGESDLVRDHDYVVWGDKAEAVDKTGVTVDGPDADGDASAYLPETSVADQDIIDTGSHDFGDSFQRIDLTEGEEAQTGSNGVNGADETSETLSATWTSRAAATPGEAAPDLGGGGGGADDIDDPATLISAIQGSGDETPLFGTSVVVEAVVTGDFQDGDADAFRSIGGFYVMEEVADRDGDDATSEGLFIDDSALTLLDVNEGDRVRVLGVATEFFGRTQITASEIRIEMVDAVDNLDAFAVNSALPGVDGREALENMLVAFDETFTVTESFNTEQFGELTLSTDGERQNFTQVNAPSVEGFADHLAERADETIQIDDGTDGRRSDFDPIVEPDGDLQSLDGLRLGQDIEPITAIVDYTFGAHKLRLPGFETFDPIEESNPRPESPAEVGGSYRVAAFNVLNFFTTFPGDDPDARGADDAAEFERQIDKLMAAFLEIDADVVGLVELQNNGAAIERLTAELNAVFDDREYAHVETGVIGSDAITNGFVYDTLTTELVGEVAVLDTPAFLDPLATGEDRNRPAVAQTFREKATEGEFTAVANHFKSKGSLTGDPADEDQGDGAGNNNATRTAAAQELADWLAADPTGAGDDDVVILGDLNAYARETPITTLEDAGDVNTVAAFEGLEQNSYRFSGEIGTLDYALANESLFGQVTGATAWNINGDEQFIFDYNEESTFSAPVLRPTDQGLFDGDSPAKSSDHDPVLLGLDLDPDAGETLTIVAAGDGYEIAPEFEVVVDGASLGTYAIESPQTAEERLANGRSWETFVFELDEAPESVAIHFSNDGGWSVGKDINLYVDGIGIGENWFESEVDGFYERAYAGAPDSHDGPRESLYWNGVLTFDDLMATV
jgi:predicted extracellular nuclease/2',3'-cyclic-nucleotide 2'-phosphodiesterase (5'-nucleotidase family)